MSYKLFGGVHDILSSVDELKLLGPNQREKGQIIAVKDGDYRVYIWDPTATAKSLLCALANEDPVNTLWPSKASRWYPQTTPSTFEERSHLIDLILSTFWLKTNRILVCKKKSDQNVLIQSDSEI